MPDRLKIPWDFLPPGRKPCPDLLPDTPMYTTPGPRVLLAKDTKKVRTENPHLNKL